MSDDFALHPEPGRLPTVSAAFRDETSLKGPAAAATIVPFAHRGGCS
jgi:hypothetical protein